jgi:hypothetical protein
MILHEIVLRIIRLPLIRWHNHAGRHREEERDHDDRFRAGTPTRGLHVLSRGIDVAVE